MTDYYFLLLRAVTALPQSTPEARQEIYQRARSALISQLQNAQPPVTESYIADQERALDEAVSRIEARASKRPVLLSSARQQINRAAQADRGSWLTDLLARASHDEARAPRQAALRPSAAELKRLTDGDTTPRVAEHPPKVDDLNKILKKFQSESPAVEASALISEDGLLIASFLPANLEETRVAGMAATLLNLSGRAAAELARGKIQEVVVRGDRGYAVMLNVGRGASLLAITNESARLGLIFLDMQEAIKALQNVL